MEEFVKCHAKECPLPATHAVPWTDGENFYCVIHAQKMIDVGNVMGFETPGKLARQMTDDEMLPTEPEMRYFLLEVKDDPRGLVFMRGLASLIQSDQEQGKSVKFKEIDKPETEEQ